jgi:hypothetical protein
LCSDKTGTLTTANMTIISDLIWTAEGFTKEQVLALSRPVRRRSTG